MNDELTHAFVRANNLRFHIVQVESDAPLILFLHGFPEFWYSWKHQLTAVAAAGYRAWAPDMRGYNTSDKPRGVWAYHLNTLALDVEELLNAAGVEKAVIVGHDWGANVAWRLAMDYTERVEKLVIMNVPHPARVSAAFAMPRQWVKSWYIPMMQTPWLPEAMMRRYPGVLAESIRLTAVHKEAFTDADIAQYRGAISQPGAIPAMLNYYRALVRWGFRLPIKPITAPTLIIWGEEDVALEKELTYGTERWVPDFRIHYIPRCGHWVQNEAADEVNEVLLDFLK